MKILVCFKAAPKVEMLLEEDWVVDKKLRVDTSFTRNELSSYDESALEMALKLLDASLDQGIPLELSALTVDKHSATPILKTLNALQFETVVRIEPRDELLFQPMAVASIISQHVRDRAPRDAVLFGRQSDIGENGKTPLLTAEMLDWACVTQAVSIEPGAENYLMVTRQVDDGYIRQRVRTPCVISVGDAPCTHLRKPTLRDRLLYGGRPIEVLAAEDFQCPVETEALMGLEVLRHARAGKIIAGKSAAEKATVLYEEHLKPMLHDA